jgi:probable F420-dependent oxidoreductase
MPHHRPFRFGVINETVLPAEQWLKHVRRVETLGYDTFLIRDHIVPDFFGDQLAPLPALMAAASATSTLRVGTLVLDNDYRHPAMLAKEAATIDYLSGGRLELGLGAGWLRREYDLAGIRFEPASVRINRLEEALQILKQLLSGCSCTFAGEHYQIDGLETVPAPVQQPRSPILLGGGKPRMLRLAGRHADIISLLTTSVSTGVLENDPTERLAPSVDQKIEWIRQGAGDRFAEIELNLIPTLIFTDDRRSRAEALIQERGWSGISIQDVLDMPSMFIGTPDQIIETMQERRERFGFSYYVFSDTEMETATPIVEALTGR